VIDTIVIERIVLTKLIA